MKGHLLGLGLLVYLLSRNEMLFSFYGIVLFIPVTFLCFNSYILCKSLKHRFIIQNRLFNQKKESISLYSGEYITQMACLIFLLGLYYSLIFYMSYLVGHFGELFIRSDDLFMYWISGFFTLVIVMLLSVCFVNRSTESIIDIDMGLKQQFDTYFYQNFYRGDRVFFIIMNTEIRGILTDYCFIDRYSDLLFYSDNYYSFSKVKRYLEKEENNINLLALDKSKLEQFSIDKSKN